MRQRTPPLSGHDSRSSGLLRSCRSLLSRTSAKGQPVARHPRISGDHSSCRVSFQPFPRHISQHRLHPIGESSYPIQLAAIAGLWGISFSVNLLPAGVAAIVSAPAKPRLRIAAALAAFYVCALSYGVMRLYTTPQASNSVLVGLVETHAGPDIFPPDAPSSIALMREYASQVQPLAARGAQFVVFPEMSALIPDSASAKVDLLFQQTARDA